MSMRKTLATKKLEVFPQIRSKKANFGVAFGRNSYLNQLTIKGKTRQQNYRISETFFQEWRVQSAGVSA